MTGEPLPQHREQLTLEELDEAFFKDATDHLIDQLSDPYREVFLDLLPIDHASGRAWIVSVVCRDFVHGLYDPQAIHLALVKWRNYTHDRLMRDPHVKGASELRSVTRGLQLAVRHPFGSEIPDAQRGIPII